MKTFHNHSWVNCPNEKVFCLYASACLVQKFFLSWVLFPTKINSKSACILSEKKIHVCVYIYIYISLHGLLHFRHFSYLSINNMEDSFFAHVTRSCKPVQRQIFVPSHPDCLLWLNDWNWGWGTAVNAICLDIKEAYNTVFLCTPSWGAIQRGQARGMAPAEPLEPGWTKNKLSSWEERAPCRVLGLGGN